MTRARRLAAILAVAALPAAAGGCFTVFQHPGARDLGTSVDDARGTEADYYPYSPTVWGWYYGHYGDYWSYYAKPWWLHHAHDGYYPTDEGFSPLPDASGFGRGGRDRDTSGWAHPEATVPPPVVTPTPPRHGTVTTSDGGASDDKPQDEKPAEKDEKANVGGRGGRR